MARIEGYGFGRLNVDGRRCLLRDVLLLPDGRVRRRPLGRWIRRHHHYDAEDVRPLLGGGTEVVVVGTGRFGGVRVNESLPAQVRSAGGELIIARTSEAVARFNELASQGRRVAGLFHLLC